MQFNIKTLLYWVPRVLALIFICFLALFALDVFVPGKSIFDYFIGLSIHLIPNIILALILIVAWKHEYLGGILFVLLALFTIVFLKTYEVPVNFLILSFPILLIGIFFLVQSRWEVKK